MAKIHLSHIMRRLLPSLLLALAAACTTDFEVNAPYQERAAIYAILDADSAFQYVRVNKGFQNRTGDARDLARNVKDSSQYKAGEILVQIFKIVRGNDSLLATLQELPVNNKSLAGDFYAPDQILYRTPAGTPIRRSAQYRVRVTNPKTGYVADAVTGITGRPDLVFPDPAPSQDPRTNSNSRNRLTFLPDQPNGGSNVSFWAACNAVGYNMTLEVPVQNFYLDGRVADTTIIINNMATLNGSRGEACGPNSLNTQEQINGRVSPSLFFSVLEASLRPSNALVSKRKFGVARAVFTSVPNSYITYLYVNNNYSPVTQSKPNYSNVSSGLGLVTSRSYAGVYVSIQPSTITAMNRKSGASFDFPALAALKFSID